jgi:hypothetical protein
MVTLNEKRVTVFFDYEYKSKAIPVTGLGGL